MEPKWIPDINGSVIAVFAYSSIVMAFASYLARFKLMHTYPVSQLAVFTFPIPVFGVAFGAIFLGEQLTKGLLFGLFFVSAGIYPTNYKKA